MNIKNIKIEKMTINDYESIKDIFNSDFDSFWNHEILKEELLNNNSIYFVAKIDDEIVGFAGIKIILDNCDIMNIVSKKSYRNNGIGSLLLETLISYAKKSNISNIFLEVSEDNLSAIHLYEKYNFQKQGIRKNYYENKNGINMILNLI